LSRVYVANIFHCVVRSQDSSVDIAPMVHARRPRNRGSISCMGTWGLSSRAVPEGLKRLVC